MPSSFLSLGISEARVAKLESIGFTEPTAIQEQAIPQLLAGADVLGQAQTGTGKTAAFALPILERLDLTNDTLQALILTPTRELAIQVGQAIRSFNTKPGAKILTVYGGSDIARQMVQLDRGVHVVVGTPGRVIDLMERGKLKLESLAWFVLDEANAQYGLHSRCRKNLGNYSFYQAKYFLLGNYASCGKALGEKLLEGSCNC
jgi:ATP-dependent RNA helicase DeaD